MSMFEWATIIGGIVTALALAFKTLAETKKLRAEAEQIGRQSSVAVHELTRNTGTSLKDSTTRIEKMVEGLSEGARSLQQDIRRLSTDLQQEREERIEHQKDQRARWDEHGRWKQEVEKHITPPSATSPAPPPIPPPHEID